MTRNKLVRDFFDKKELIFFKLSNIFVEKLPDFISFSSNFKFISDPELPRSGMILFQIWIRILL